MTTIVKPKSLGHKSTSELRAWLSRERTLTLGEVEELATHAIQCELAERYDDPGNTNPFGGRVDFEEGAEEFIDQESAKFNGKHLNIDLTLPN